MNHSFCIILPNIRSAHNIGSIFRTADAFGADKIYLCGYSASPPHKGIEKTALGAEHSISWEKHRYPGRILAKLKQAGYQIVAVEQTKNALDYRAWKPRFPLALVFGNEVLGLDARLCLGADIIIHIPQIGAKESLNVSVAAGIICARVRSALDNLPLA